MPYRKEVLDRIRAAGFKVYMRVPARDTWALFTDGKRIGYVQWSRFDGIKLTTAHVPNRQTGTGFQVTLIGPDPLSKGNLEAAFAHAPGWADSRDRESVVKWRDWDHFHNANEWNKGYREVLTEDAPEP